MRRSANLRGAADGPRGSRGIRRRGRIRRVLRRRGAASASPSAREAGAAPPPIDPNAFYVAPTGSDANLGSLASPFKTLEKARDAMRASPHKTTYLRAGTYARTGTLTLDAQDAGETWAYYPPDGANTAILDGGGAVGIMIEWGGDDITLDGIRIQNFQSYGVHHDPGQGAPTLHARVGARVLPRGVEPGARGARELSARGRRVGTAWIRDPADGHRAVVLALKRTPRVVLFGAACDSTPRRPCTHVARGYSAIHAAHARAARAVTRRHAARIAPARASRRA